LSRISTVIFRLKHWTRISTDIFRPNHWTKSPTIKFRLCHWTIISIVGYVFVIGVSILFLRFSRMWYFFIFHFTTILFPNVNICLTEQEARTMFLEKKTKK
jgi:hypothetical protein